MKKGLKTLVAGIVVVGSAFVIVPLVVYLNVGKEKGADQNGT